MTSPIVAQTKLDAVNLMLASIGQSPVNTLSGTLPKDVNKAVVALDSALREVLTQGWSFNSDKEYEMTPDGTFRIAVPAASLQIDPTYGEDYVPGMTPRHRQACSCTTERRTHSTSSRTPSRSRSCGHSSSSRYHNTVDNTLPPRQPASFRQASWRQLFCINSRAMMRARRMPRSVVSRNGRNDSTSTSTRSLFTGTATQPEGNLTCQPNSHKSSASRLMPSLR